MSYQREFENRLNVALVGVGSHAYRNILPTLHYVPVRLKALCDLNFDLAKKTAEEYISANRDVMHWFYEISVLGYKYNMNDLAASIGLVQLEKLPSMNKRRSEIIKRYMKGIKGMNKIEPLIPFQPDKYVYQMFGVRSDERDDLMVFLKSKGIATGCHYTPLTMQPLFKSYVAGCPIAEREHFRLITLPLHANLTNEEVDYVIAALQSYENH